MAMLLQITVLWVCPLTGGGVVGGAGNKSHLFIVNIGVCEVGSSGEGTFSGSNLADFFPFCSTSGARRRMFSS